MLYVLPRQTHVNYLIVFLNLTAGIFKKFAELLRAQNWPQQWHPFSLQSLINAT